MNHTANLLHLFPQDKSILFDILTPNGKQLMLGKEQKCLFGGSWEAQSVNLLPSAQIMTLGSWDQVRHQGPYSAGSLLLPCLLRLLLPLLVCASLLSLSDK